MPQQSARRIALSALRKWETGHRFADAILHELLAINPLPASDRAFVTELFYGVLRNLTLLDFWIDLLRDGRLDRATRDLLRLGLYQLFMLRTPEHAAVYETVHLSNANQRTLINGVLRTAQRRRDELQAEAAAQPLEIRTSHPAFLIARWRKRFGAEIVEAMCEWNNSPAPVYVRINQIKIQPKEFLRQYSSASTLPGYPDFIELSGIPIDAIERGFCYIQDPSTTIACQLLDAQPGENVLDVCAAPGGKTAIIAQQMLNRGAIVACDRDQHRVERLAENLHRLGVQVAMVTQRDWTRDSADPLPLNQFDRILLDAPCSNTGVMRRRVDVRWRLKPDDFARMQNQQLALARSALRFLKPDGVFIYSTCSMELEENEQVVAGIGAEFPQLALMEQTSVTPFRDGFDGAFAAKFIGRG